jgi:hypothetical protein
VQVLVIASARGTARLRSMAPCDLCRLPTACQMSCLEMLLRSRITSKAMT